MKALHCKNRYFLEKCKVCKIVISNIFSKLAAGKIR